MSSQEEELKKRESKVSTSVEVEEFARKFKKELSLVSIISGSNMVES